MAVNFYGFPLASANAIRSHTKMHTNRLQCALRTHARKLIFLFVSLRSYIFSSFFRFRILGCSAQSCTYHNCLKCNTQFIIDAIFVRTRENCIRSAAMDFALRCEPPPPLPPFNIETEKNINIQNWLRRRNKLLCTRWCWQLAACGPTILASALHFCFNGISKGRTCCCDCHITDVTRLNTRNECRTWQRPSICMRQSRKNTFQTTHNTTSYYV